METAELIERIRPPRYVDGELQAQRLFHGRGKCHAGFEHLVIDLFPPIALVGLYRPVPDRALEQLARWIHGHVDGAETVLVQKRWSGRAPTTALIGQIPSESFTVNENGLRYRVWPGQHRNAGLFLDMSNGRQWVRKQARDRRVLNLFAYRCAFSVAAIAGGAKCVMNVDTSRSALSTGRDNHRLNDLPLERVRFERLDVFRSFGRLRRRGPFDLLICDPPTRQHGSIDVVKDYPKILRRLDEFMAPRSTLLLCLNSPALGRDFLLDAIAGHAPQYRFSTDIPPPDVFCDAEDRGLKTMVFHKD